MTELVGSFRSAYYLALLSDGSVRCWGKSGAGECGPSKRNVTAPVVIGSLAAAVQVSAGNSVASARHADGTASWWGNPPVSSMAPDTAPTKIPGIAGAVELRVGGPAACARFSGGIVKCWGLGNDYTLGNGSLTASYAPSFVTVTVPPATAIEVGFLTVFAVVTGEARGWGYDLNGQVGVDASGGDVMTPAAVFGYASQVAASQEFTCATLTTGGVKCAGLNNRGQLGDGSKTTRATPASVAGLSLVKQTTVGLLHACALTTSGAVSCWGANNSSQLGDGTTTDSSLPLTVPLTNVAMIAAAVDSTCALDNDRVTIRCWGDNTFGQLGAGLDPTTYPKKLSPVSVAW
ncbi:MAG: RCC1 domain-containing protein [Polyangiales bacterium]